MPMALQSIQRRSLPDEVFEQLTAEIVSGAYSPGDAIPSERELSDTLAVNRHVIREAIKRLEQIGLVKGSQGGRTKVLDFRSTAGLDLLAVLAESSGALEATLPLLTAALEMRAGIGADLARLCAQRAGGEVGKDLIARAGELVQVREGVELLDVDARFWQRVLDGAGNLAYQLAFNSLLRTVHAHIDFSVPWIEAELQRSEYRRPVAAAIAARDPERAAAVTREALTPPKGFPRALSRPLSRSVGRPR
jgi:DNA-binding FadR family transcriptional regulator